MKYVKIIYNSFLWSLTIATLCFKNEWLQMRVNTGFIFFALLIILSVGLSIAFRKKEIFLNFIFTAGSLAVCTVTGLAVFGFARMKVVPAALIREGIHQTGIPFSKVNLVLMIITAGGFLIILASDLLKKNRK